MGKKGIRLVGLFILVVFVFKVVLQQSSAAATAVETDNSVHVAFEAGSAASQTQIEVTRVVYVTATPSPTPTEEPAQPEQPATESVEREPLAVVEQTPSQQRAADIQPTFRLVFNKMVNQLTLQENLTVEPEVELSFYWESQNVLLIRPLSPLEAETYYHFQIARNLTAVDGATMVRFHRWTYRAMKLVDTYANEVSLYGRDTIEVNFNYPIDPASLTWAIEPEAPGDLTWSRDHKTLTFASSAAFVAGTSYSVSLGDNLKQPNGMSLPPAEQFEIEVEGLAGPRLPEPRNNDVDPFTEIRISFRRPVDKSRVEAGLTFSPELTTAPEIRWEDNVLLADVALSSDTHYIVQIDAENLVDEQGNALSLDPISWSFKTRKIERLVDFGNGPRLQAIQLNHDANDHPAVQYSFYNSQHPVPVTFELYELILSDWQSTPALAEHDFTGQLPLATWEEAAPLADPNRYFLAHETFLPEGLTPGFYRLQMNTYGEKQDEIALILTDLALGIRTDGDQVLAWVVDIATLTPVTAEVTVYRGSQPLSSANTDGDGLASFFVEGLKDESDAPIIVIARAGEQFTLAALNSAWGSYYGASYSSEQPDYLLHLTMDRPLYEPGETAYLRAVLRESVNGAPTLMPPGQVLTATVRGYVYDVGLLESDEPVYLTTNEYGVAYGEITIPANFATGEYYAEINYRGVSHSRGFEVSQPQDEAAPIVKVTTVPIIGEGQMLDVVVEVTDSAGAPLTDATVNISFLQPAGGSSGCYWNGGENYWFNTDDYNATGKTDRNGVYDFSVPAEMGYDIHYPHPGNNLSHSIKAVVAKATQNGVEGVGFSVVEIASAGEELSWLPSSKVQAAGQPFVVQGMVSDLAGAPVAGRLVSINLHEIGAYGISTYYEPGDRLFRSQSESDANGRIMAELTVEKPGYYELRLVSQDSLGHELTASRALYVTGEGEAVGVGSLKLGIGAVDNFVGQTTQLVIMTDSPGPALLTLSNRDGVRNETVMLTNYVNIVELSLTEADVPLLDIEVDLWLPELPSFDNDDYYGSYYSSKDADLLTSSIAISVVDQDKQLHVSVLETGEVDENGQTAVTVQVLNGRGEPVSAEVALSIANQTLYSHFPDHNRPQSYSLFRSNLVNQNVYHSFEPQRDLSHEFFGGCGCGGGWWGEEWLPAPVNNMPSFWFTGLHTDHNGQATITMTLPENPDGWHIAAHAITADGQVGEVSQQMSD